MFSGGGAFPGLTSAVAWPATGGNIECAQFPDAGNEVAARHFAGAERGEMRRCHLAVDECVAVLSQVACQVGEGDLGGIGRAREHGFSVEHAAEGNTVQAAGQLSADPGFDRMEPQVGGLHFAGNPGAVLSFAGHCGAGADDGGEVVI